jgi:hypothetical protein
MHLLGERFIFFAGDQWGREKGSQDLFNGTKIASQLANLFYCIIVFTCIIYV